MNPRWRCKHTVEVTGSGRGEASGPDVKGDVTGMKYFRGEKGRVVKEKVVIGRKERCSDKFGGKVY